MQDTNIEFAYGAYPPGHPHAWITSHPPRRWVRLDGGPWFEARGKKWHEVRAALELLREAFSDATEDQEGITFES